MKPENRRYTTKFSSNISAALVDFLNTENKNQDSASKPLKLNPQKSSMLESISDETEFVGSECSDEVPKINKIKETIIEKRNLSTPSNLLVESIHLGTLEKKILEAKSIDNKVTPSKIKKSKK